MRTSMEGAVMTALRRTSPSASRISPPNSAKSTNPLLVGSTGVAAALTFIAVAMSAMRVTTHTVPLIVLRRPFAKSPTR